MNRHQRMTLASLLELIEHDEDLLDSLESQGLIERGTDETYEPVMVERVLVCRTLVREMEINWAGVEVVLHMREELLATRDAVAELVRRLRAAEASH